MLVEEVFAQLPVAELCKLCLVSRLWNQCTVKGWKSLGSRCCPAALSAQPTRCSALQRMRTHMSLMAQLSNLPAVVQHPPTLCGTTVALTAAGCTIATLEEKALQLSSYDFQQTVQVQYGTRNSALALSDHFEALVGESDGSLWGVDLAAAEPIPQGRSSPYSTKIRQVCCSNHMIDTRLTEFL